MKAIILARVSTLRQEKEGLSLEEIQIPALRDYAKEKGMEIVKEFVFCETADSKIRKNFNEVVDFFIGNKDITAIVSFRVDRVTRNYRDAVLFDDLRMDKSRNTELHFVNDRLILTKNSSGRDIGDWDFKVFYAKQQITRCRDDAINSYETKLRKGERASKAPFGYINEKVNGRNWIIPDPYKRWIVIKTYEYFTQGSLSCGRVAQIIREEFNYKTFSKSSCHKVLKDPFYYGGLRKSSIT